MKLVINEFPPQVIVSLTLAVALNEVIVLLKLYFKLPVSPFNHEEEKWVFKTYEKWSGIDCSTLHELTMQNAPSVNEAYTEEAGQIALTRQGNLTLAITKEVKNSKKKPVEKDLDVVSVIL